MRRFVFVSCLIFAVGYSGGLVLGQYSCGNAAACGGGAGCIPVPTSLTPVNCPPPPGAGAWECLCGGNCGGKRRFWFFFVPCGNPLATGTC